MVTIAFPKQLLESHATLPVEIAPQTLHVQSHGELQRFLTRAYAANTTTVGVRGTIKAHLGALSYNVKLDKHVKLVGLNGLPGMRITEMVPTAPEDEGNASLNGSLRLPNPSAMTLDLGDVYYKVSSGGVQVGTSWAKNLHIDPGVQDIPYQGELLVDEIVDKDNDWVNFKQISSTMDEGGHIHFDIVGDRAYVNDEPIAYLDGVIAQIQLKVAPCYLTAQEAIPQSKQYFDAINYFDAATAFACDMEAPL